MRILLFVFQIVQLLNVVNAILMQYSDRTLIYIDVLSRISHIYHCYTYNMNAISQWKANSVSFA